MSQRSPTTQRRCPLPPSAATTGKALDLGAAAPYELMQGAWGQAHTCRCQCPFLGAAYIYAIEKYRENQGLGLRRLPLDREIQHNQDSALAAGQFLQRTEEEQLGRNVWGCNFLLFGATIGETKI